MGWIKYFHLRLAAWTVFTPRQHEGISVYKLCFIKHTKMAKNINLVIILEHQHFTCGIRSFHWRFPGAPASPATRNIYTQRSKSSRRKACPPPQPAADWLIFARSPITETPEKKISRHSHHFFELRERCEAPSFLGRAGHQDWLLISWMK